jgi:sugar lactone lactonase YvrE
MDAADKNVLLSAGHKIWQVTSDGEATVIAGSDTAGYADGAPGKARFGGAMVICVDPSNNIYVADLGNNAVRMVTPGGQVTTIAGNGTPGYQDGQGMAATFNGPSGIAFTTSGNKNILYVSDFYNNVIRRVTFPKQ